MLKQEEIDSVRRYVKLLNSIFNKNHWYPKQKMFPFKGILTKQGEWLIVCCDFYTWNDDPRFKQIKNNIKKAGCVDFKFAFDGKDTIFVEKEIIVK